MKKVLVVTYCTWTSIGSILQSLGLKNMLNKLGYDSVILLKKGENDINPLKVNSFKRFIIWIHQLFNNKKRKSAYNKRMEFIRNNLKVEYFETENDFHRRSNKKDVLAVIAGSDQIWNPLNIKSEFFLDFVKHKKKISYAASMGHTIINEEKKVIFKNYLKEFDYISVRENECKKVLQKLIDKDIEVNIDPVFLSSIDEWRKYEKEYSIKDPYILLYMLYWNESYKSRISELKKKTGLKVIAIVNQLSKVNADQFLYDVGPEEFLWLIDHAEYVVSSSFHGVAFSILFNKKFSAVINPKSPSRIKNIMDILQVPDIEVENLPDFNVDCYTTINDIIELEKDRSIKYLEKVLSYEYFEEN